MIANTVDKWNWSSLRTLAIRSFALSYYERDGGLETFHVLVSKRGERFWAGRNLPWGFAYAWSYIGPAGSGRVSRCKLVVLASSRPTAIFVSLRTDWPRESIVRVVLTVCDKNTVREIRVRVDRGSQTPKISSTYTEIAEPHLRRTTPLNNLNLKS